MTAKQGLSDEARPSPATDCDRLPARTGNTVGACQTHGLCNAACQTSSICQKPRLHRASRHILPIIDLVHFSFAGPMYRRFPDKAKGRTGERNQNQRKIRDNRAHFGTISSAISIDCPTHMYDLGKISGVADTRSLASARQPTAFLPAVRLCLLIPPHPNPQPRHR